MKKTIGLFLSLIAFASAAQAADIVPHWQILPDKSRIEWTATYGGKAVKGNFPQFTADITFDPAHPDASHAIVKVMMDKVASDDKDAKENLPTNDWFAAAQYPLAVFETSRFAYKGNDAAQSGKSNEYNGAMFEAEGTLSIRGKPVKIILPFTTTFYSDNAASVPTRYARIDGKITLKRLDFGVGQGDWAKTDAVADAVEVAIHLEAKQVP